MKGVSAALMMTMNLFLIAIRVWKVKTGLLSFLSLYVISEAVPMLSAPKHSLYPERKVSS